MLQLNEATVVGLITHDLELNEGKNATYLRFQVAVPREYRKDTEEQESDFINAAAFSGTAEFIDKYFGKGSPIYLKGRIQTGEYEDGDGVTHRTFTLIVERAKFVQSKKEAEAASGEPDRPENSGKGSGRASDNSKKRSSSKSSRGSDNSGRSAKSGGRSGTSGKSSGRPAVSNNVPFDPDDDGDLPF